MALKRLISLVLTVTVVSSCQFGGAQFEGSIGGYSFDPSGTVFAYIDHEDKNGHERVLKPLFITMTWISVDPVRDLNDLGDRQEKIANEFESHDALALIFNNEKDIVTGKNFATNRLRAWIHLDQRKLATVGSAEVEQMRKTLKVRITKYDLSPSNPVIEGDIEFYSSQSRIKGSFSAPIVDKTQYRVAKQNWSTLSNHTDFHEFTWAFN